MDRSTFGIIGNRPLKATMTANTRRRNRPATSYLLSACLVFALFSSQPNNAAASSTASSPVVTAPPPPPSTAAAAAAADGEGKNPVVALAGFVKDQLVRMKDGTVQLYTNYQKCGDIRSKQRLYAERTGLAKRTATTGGITYEEFDFLQRGKDDRSKLASLVMMGCFAPNFLPYAIMFNPGMMPSPFKVPPRRSGVEETRWEAISRQRTHAVISAMLDMEKSARVAPTLSKMNPFGGAKTRRNMERIDRMGHTGGTLLAANNADGPKGGACVLDILADEIYKSKSEEPFTKKESQLVTCPKPIIKGLANAIQAESPPSSLLPSFLLRGQVINHIQKVSMADEFLVNQNVDLTTINSNLLMEACNLRLICGPGRSDEELRQGLKQWLDAVVVQPNAKTKGGTDMHYNANLARAALMGYNAIDGARDARSSSYLPRLLFQGQYGGQLMARYEEEVGSKKRRGGKKK